MKVIIWSVLIGSSLLLMLQLIRNRQAGRWLSTLGLNLAFAALILYVLNLISGYIHFTLPINLVTVATVTVLGIPGVLLLALIKYMLL